MNGNGYDSATKPSAQFFTKEQRIRLEALTVAKKLYPSDPYHCNITVAQFIVGDQK